MSTQLRTQETRHKIALGELVIQAGLGAADPTLLLGGLMSLCKQIENDPEALEDMQSLGTDAMKSLRAPQ